MNRMNFGMELMDDRNDRPTFHDGLGLLMLPQMPMIATLRHHHIAATALALEHPLHDNDDDASDNDDADELEDVELDEDDITGLSPALESRIVGIRNNNPNMKHLYIGSTIDPRAWKQLGQWLHKSKHVSYACLVSCHLRGKSMSDLCKGLQHNTSIREFEIGENKLSSRDMENLSPFITNNPILHSLTIDGCLSKSGVKLLSDALTQRTNSIENISLDGNCMGRGKIENFDAFVDALIKNKELKRLSLMGNQIGKECCTSLGRLLKHPDSKLMSLVLRHNCIDDQCVDILSKALVDNTTLNNIDLDRNGGRNGPITERGLYSFLQLISGTPSATIKLKLRLKAPRGSSTDDDDVEKCTNLQIKMNEPLHKLADQLCDVHEWASSSSKLRFSVGWRSLDLIQSPFFHGLKDGDTIDVNVESDGVVGYKPLPEDGGVPSKNYDGILGTFKSNHTLTSIGYETALKRGFVHGNLLREYLDANKRSNKMSAARVKIFRTHVQHSLSVEEWREMDTVMPRILAWIGTALSESDDDRTFIADAPTPLLRLDAFYRILKNFCVAL